MGYIRFIGFLHLYPFYRLPSPLPFELAVHDDTAGLRSCPCHM